MQTCTEKQRIHGYHLTYHWEPASSAKDGKRQNDNNFIALSVYEGDTVTRVWVSIRCVLKSEIIGQFVKRNISRKFTPGFKSIGSTGTHLFLVIRIMKLLESPTSYKIEY